jgi:hypothetical protein
MGTWGTGPFDSDDAGDMIAGLMKPIRLVVARKTNASASYHYCAARAAARLVIEAHGTDVLGGPPIDLVLRALVRIRRDGDWIASWRSPRKLARALNAEIMDVFDVINHCRHCGRAHGTKELVAMAEVVSDVMRIPVRGSTFPDERIRVGRRKRRRYVWTKRGVEVADAFDAAERS